MSDDDKESIERLLDLLLETTERENEASAELVEAFDRLLKKPDPAQLDDPEGFGLAVELTVRRPLERILERVAERHITVHGRTLPRDRGDRWRLNRLWADREGINHRLASVVRVVDRTTYCEADKSRHMLRLREQELTHGEPLDGWSRGNHADEYWIPAHGRWESWRPLVDACIADRLDADALACVCALMLL